MKPNIAVMKTWLGIVRGEHSSKQEMIEISKTHQGVEVRESHFPSQSSRDQVHVECNLTYQIRKEARKQNKGEITGKLSP